MKRSAEVCGLVLAGGKSERMGSDKGLLNVHGEHMRGYLFGQLRCVCTNAYVSCRREQQVPSLMNPIFDESFAPGPLNGLLSAFNHNASCAWLTVAVDMPYVDATILQLLIAQRDPEAAATSFFNESLCGPEPFLTIWEPATFLQLKKFVENGNVSARYFLSEHPVKLLQSPSAHIFRSLNDPDDIMEMTYVCDGGMRLKRTI